MSASDRADAYLTIPADYGLALGGVRWSRGCDAIELEDGRTLALVDQIGQVLEGVFAGPNIPPFVFVLNLLHALKYGRSDGGPPELLRLKEAYAQAGPTGTGRTAGVLIGELCRSLPSATNPPTWPQLDLTLKRRLLFGERHRPELAEVPPVGRTGFESLLAAELRRYDVPSLVHRLKQGSPEPSGDRLAEVMFELPGGIGQLREVMQTRPRSVGAVALAPTLDAAITLPPRKPRADRLPIGGYADVTTRGDPARLLPSQFALEGDEFVRRFAENELLYFLREEPREPDTPERWLILDQGIRTWGAVRHGLTAGVLTLLGKMRKPTGPVQIAVTSCAEPLDPAILGVDGVAEKLVASDLTRTPAETLRRVLAETPTDSRPRDLVLLTHPRTFQDPGLQQLLRMYGPNDRLFALTVNDHGDAEWGEWKTAGWSVLRRFRADLAAAEAATVPNANVSPGPQSAHPEPWTGDVEPVPFPFRCGLVSDVFHLGFEANGEWVVAVGRDGCVQARRLDTDGPVEVLPRAYRNGEVLTKVEAVLGVNGGVVVCGRISNRAFTFDGVSISVAAVSSATLPDEAMAIAHYDFVSSTVQIHRIHHSTFPASWYSLRDLHCVVVRLRDHPETETFSLDLDTRALYPSSVGSELSSRAQLAYSRAMEGDLGAKTVRIDKIDDGVSLTDNPRSWSLIRPVVEGQPVFADVTPYGYGYIAGGTLAVRVTNRDHRTRIVIVRGSDSTLLNDVPVGLIGAAFTVAENEEWYAVQTHTRDISVRGVGSATGPTRDLANAGLHTRLEFHLVPTGLMITVGQHHHAFVLNPNEFRHTMHKSRKREVIPGNEPGQYEGTDIQYDRWRFIELQRAGPWMAAFDRWGQVVLMNHHGRLMMTILIRRELAAIWLPDGTRWGSPALLGGPPSPDAVAQIGRALAQAAEEPR